MKSWANEHAHLFIEFKLMSNEHGHQKRENFAHEHQKPEYFAHEHVNELYFWVKISLSMVFRDFNLSILVIWSHGQAVLIIEQAKLKISIRFWGLFWKKNQGFMSKNDPDISKKFLKIEHMLIWCSWLFFHEQMSKHEQKSISNEQSTLANRMSW